MSDLHPLPLKGHDLPRLHERARVFKEGESWIWEHRCTPESKFCSLPAPGLPWERVVRGALAHLGWCW